MQINYLTGLGIPTRDVENMASISKLFLGRSADDLKQVVEFLQKEGLEGKTLIAFLIANPPLLNYTPAADGSCLEKGSTRASLTFGERDGKKVAGLVLWREGTAFGTAPVAPEKPQKA